jgi:hypothetical protein
MYIKIKKAALAPDNYGNIIKITMVGLYDENGKWIKWVKLDKVFEAIINAKITYNEKD